MYLYTVLTFIILIEMLYGLSPDGTIYAIWHSQNNKSISKKTKNYHFLCGMFATATMIFLWHLTAFRGPEIGNDTAAYIRAFENIRAFGVNRENRYLELGFQYICRFIGTFTSNPHVFLIAISSILYLVTYYYILHNSDNTVISVVLFYALLYSSYTNTIRQELAICVIMFAYMALKNRNRMLFVLLVLVASTLHTSALVCMLLLFGSVLPIRNTRVTLIASVVIALLSASGMLDEVISMIAPRYINYFMRVQAKSGWLATTYLIARNMITYLIVSRSTSGRDDMKLEESLFWFLLVSSSLGYSVNIFSRVSEYFWGLAIVEFPNTVYRGEIENKEMWIAVVCLISIIWFSLFLYFRPEWNRLIPFTYWK